jgi:hypothetical protein
MWSRWGRHRTHRLLEEATPRESSMPKTKDDVSEDESNDIPRSLRVLKMVLEVMMLVARLIRML